jgi:hypothetical protein
MQRIDDSTRVNRRQWLITSSVMLGAMFTMPRVAPSAPIKVNVRRDPGCTCCEGWAAHMKRAGFDVTIADDPRLSAYKDLLHVPADLRTCHTSTIGGYVFEGHVPVDAIQRFLKGPGAAIGLGVAGMPAGSPGMESSSPEHYEIVAFSATKQWLFAKR